MSLAFLLAPLVAATAALLLATGFDGTSHYVAVGLLPLFMIPAYGPALFLGVPAIFAFREFAKPTLVNVVATAASIAIAPWTFLFLAEEQIGVPLTALASASGLVGGVAFWFIAFFRLQP